MDKSAPTVDQTVNISCAASDALSGIASTTWPSAHIPAYSLPVGSSNLTATATDMAANTSTVSARVTVSDTPTGLCLVTKQFIQTSARYQALTLPQRTQIDRLVNALCSQLSSIQLTPEQKALLVKAYEDGVAALVPAGWLTRQQPTILISLAISCNTVRLRTA